MTGTLPCPICGTMLGTDNTLCTRCGADYSTTTLGIGDSPTIVRLRASGSGDLQPLVADLVATLSSRLHGLRQLGRGGMGLVFVGRDPLLKRDVAVKVLAPEYVADDQARERFIREAQAAAAVAHPNVVGIFQVGELNATRVPYFLMQFIEGNTVEQQYPDATSAPEPVARRIIAEVAAALAAAHARGLVHRDIKPSNVMLDPHTGRAIVLDFGISASLLHQPGDEKLTAQGVYIGTPRYMSPEQASGEPIGEKSDVYSLGCLAYELLGGRKVFTEKNVLALLAAHMRDVPTPLVELCPGIDRELGALVMRCLEKNPAKRPPAAELAQRLSPGAGVMLEWPPPALQSLHRKLSGIVALSWLSSAMLLFTGLTLVLAGPSMPALTESLGALLLLLPGLFSVFPIASAAVRAFRLGRSASAALAGGYGWLTIAETIADHDGQSGDLIAGSRRFALLTPAQRNELRRGRLVRAAALLTGGLGPAPALLLAVIVARIRPYDPHFATGVLLLPACAMLVAAHVVQRERQLAPPLRRAQNKSEALDAASVAPAWYESFEQARAEQSLGAGSRERTRLAISTGLLVTVVGIILVVALLPLGAIVAIGAMASRLDVLGADWIEEKNRIAGIARKYVLPADERISVADAGKAFNDLMPPPSNAGGFKLVSTNAPPARTWNKRPPASALFATARPDTAVWEGPDSKKVLEAARGGFSADEAKYFQLLGSDPGWRHWTTMARARRADLLGAQFVLPYPAAGGSLMRMPVPRFGVIREYAHASTALAAQQLAAGHADSAETLLRQTISVGFLLRDNAPWLIDELWGNAVINIGRDGLTRLYLLTGNPSGPRLKASYDSATTARDARREAMEVDSARGAITRADLVGERRKLLALTLTPGVSRGLRLEALRRLSRAPCSNLREFVFGPGADVREAFDRGYRDLTRFASDSAMLKIMERQPERGTQGDDFSAMQRVLLGTTSAIGFITHNPRVRGCFEMIFWGY